MKATKLWMFVLMFVVLASSGYATSTLINGLEDSDRPTTSIYTYDGYDLTDTYISESIVGGGEPYVNNEYFTTSQKSQGLYSLFFTATGTTVNSAISIGPSNSGTFVNANGHKMICVDIKFNETSSTNYMLSLDNSTTGINLISNSTMIIGTTDFETECVNIPNGYTGNITGLWIFTNRDNTDHRINYYIDNIRFIDYSNITYQENSDSYAVGNGVIYLNYTKPVNATNAIWMVKHGANPYANPYNITIPNSCFNARSSLNLRFISQKFNSVRAESYGQCYNGTNWQTITFLINSSEGVSAGSGADESYYFLDGNYNYDSFVQYVVEANSWRRFYITGDPLASNASIFEEGIFWITDTQYYPSPSACYQMNLTGNVPASLTQTSPTYPINSTGFVNIGNIFDNNPSTYASSPSTNIGTNKSTAQMYFNYSTVPYSSTNISVTYSIEPGYNISQFFLFCQHNNSLLYVRQIVIDTDGTGGTIQTVNQKTSSDCDRSDGQVKLMMQAYVENATSIPEGVVKVYDVVAITNTTVTSPSTPTCTYKNYNYALTSFCYQESANVATGCGGLGTGSYSNTSNYIYINYTKPTNAIGFLWQLKHGTYTTYNYSFTNYYMYDYPKIMQCIQNKSIVQLRLYSNVSSNPSYSYGECYTGSEWVSASSIASDSSVGSVATGIGGETLAYDGDYNTYTCGSDTGQWRTTCDTRAVGGRLYDEGIYWTLTQSNGGTVPSGYTAIDHFDDGSVNPALWNYSCTNSGTPGTSSCSTTEANSLLTIFSQAGITGGTGQSYYNFNIFDTSNSGSYSNKELVFYNTNLTLSCSAAAGGGDRAGGSYFYVGIKNTTDNNVGHFLFFNSNNPIYQCGQVGAGSQTLYPLINANITLKQNSSNQNQILLYVNNTFLYSLDISSIGNNWSPFFQTSSGGTHEGGGTATLVTDLAMYKSNFVIPVNNCTSNSEYYVCAGNFVNTTINTNLTVYIINGNLTTTSNILINTTSNITLQNTSISSLGTNGGAGSTGSGGCSGASGGSGSSGGNNEISLLATGDIILIDSNLTVKGGNGGDGGYASCTCSFEYFECHASGGSAGSGGYAYMTLNTTGGKINITNTPLNIISGTAGNGGGAHSTCNNPPGQTCSASGGNGGNGGTNKLTISTPTNFYYNNNNIYDTYGGGGNGGGGSCSGGCGGTSNGASGSAYPGTTKLACNQIDFVNNNFVTNADYNRFNVFDRFAFAGGKLTSTYSIQNFINFSNSGSNFLKLDTVNITNNKFNVICPLGSTLTALIENTLSSQVNFSQCQGTINYISNIAFNYAPSLNNDSMWNTEPLPINITVYTFYTPTTCQLYVNNTLTSSQTKTETGDVTFNLNMSFPEEGRFNYFFRCSNSETTKDSSNYSIIYDTQSPMINTAFTNNKLVGTGSSLTGQFNFSDNFYLYSYNITVDGQQIDYVGSLNTNATSYNLNYAPTGLSAGPHTLGVKVADGHTNQELEDDYTVYKGFFGDILQFSYDEGNTKIYEKGGSWRNNFIEQKKKDRYSWTFEPYNTKPEYTFVVESNNKIEIINAPETHLRKWLIIGDKWMDFDVANETPSLDIIRINDKRVEVTIGDLSNPEKLTFNSFGELNIIQQNYTFFTFNVTVTYDNPVAAEATGYSSTFKIYKGTNAYNISNISHYYSDYSMNGTVVLTEKNDFYNYEKYTASYNTPSVPSSMNKTAIWNFTTTTGNNYAINYSQYLAKIGVSANCTAPAARAIVFSYTDEANYSNVMNATLNAYLSVKIPSMAQSTAFINLTFPNAQNASICINPPEDTYVMDSIMEYYAPGFANRKYYLINNTLSNITQYIKLYEIATTDATNIQLKVYDQNKGTPISGAYIQVLRYYPELNAYKVVEVGKSDENGFAIAKMKTYDTFYKFNVYYQNELKLSTEVQTVYTGTKLLPIVVSEDPLKSAQLIPGVDTEVKCEIATKTCHFTWSDASGIVREAKFEVYRRNGFGMQNIYTQTSSSAAGTLFYTVSENMTGNTYIAKAWIDSNTAHTGFFIGQDEMGENDPLSAWGGLKTILFVTMMLVIVLAWVFMDLGPAGIVGGSSLGLIVLIFLKMTPLAWGVWVTLTLVGGYLAIRLEK